MFEWQIYEYNSKSFETLFRFIWHIDEILTVITSLGQSGTWSNGIERMIRHTPSSHELEPRHQMQFTVITRTAIFIGWELWFLRLCRGCSRQILNPVVMVKRLLTLQKGMAKSIKKEKKNKTYLLKLVYKYLLYKTANYANSPFQKAVLLDSTSPSNPS